MINSFHFIISHAKLYGFIFPSCELYNGINAIYDYGPYGILLKNNIKDFWWKSMIQTHKNIVGMDSSILMKPIIWKASGHIDAFNDLYINNRNNYHRYRVDFLIEDFCNKLEFKIKNISEKNKNFLGKKFNKYSYFYTKSKIKKLKRRKENIMNIMILALNEKNLNCINNLIKDLEIKDIKNGSKNWIEAYKLNLMFKTYFSSYPEDSMELYLRPETAQGSFINFSNVNNSTRIKIPFGIAQIGKVFRNEIIARQFLFRMKEFEQMEMQFFVNPIQEKEWFEFWKKKRFKWHLSLISNSNFYRYHNHDKLAHYAKAATDIEFLFPFGFKEIEGIHSRTDFDLKNHQKFSGKKIQYFDTKNNKYYIPYIIETSLGLDRMFLCLFSYFLKEEELSVNKLRSVLKLPTILAPIKGAIFPLSKKDGLPELAEKVFNELKYKYMMIYESNDSIGSRYRRQDAIGTPFCFTVDYKSLQDYSITVRYRDNMKQERLSINKLTSFLEENLFMQYNSIL